MNLEPNRMVKDDGDINVSPGKVLQPREGSSDFFENCVYNTVESLNKTFVQKQCITLWVLRD